MSDEQDIDLGLVRTNDVAHVFVRTPDKAAYALPTLERSSSSGKRSSTSFIQGDPELSERQERAHARRPSLLNQLSRSYTLPRKYPRSPPHSSRHLFETSFDHDVVVKLNRWVLSFIVVNFDLDQGPVMEGCCPQIPLTDCESENIAFSAIPDSFRGSEGYDTHTFRIREVRPSKSESDASAQDHPLKSRPSSSDGFLYGFAFFSRRKDDTTRRGYDQQSLILLTYHPWPALFLDLITRLGPMYLAHGEPMLEAVCHNVASWPAPKPLEIMELGFLGTVLQVELPGGPNQQQSNDSQAARNTKSGPGELILASMAPIRPSPLKTFGATLSHMWSIWECILLCEPVIVFGASPAMTSQAVWWFVDVLRPTIFGGDFRPYFTIHDKDYQALVNKNPPKQGLMLGVTNPLFESLCKHWPHKLVLGTKVASRKSNQLIYGPTPGWETKTHNRFISKDRELLKRLESLVKKDGPIDPDGSAGLLLRRHFTTRSVQFLVPLTRYLNTLIPSPRLSSSLSHETQRVLRPFNRDHFFASLKTHGSPLPFRSGAKQKEFYERWLRSPAFGLWMARQEETIHEFLRKGE